MKHHVIAGPIAILILASLFGGCGERIPPEAPGLSEQLGIQIETVRKSHISAVHQVFALKRDEVDRFYQETWLPKFALTSFKSDGIKEQRDWVTSCPSMTAQARLEAEAQVGKRIDCNAEAVEFFVHMGVALQAELESQKAAVVAPLDELERALIAKIEAKYTELRAINNSLTAFLVSASEVTETRDRYLKKAGITDAKMDEAVTQIDGILAEFLATAKKVEDGAEPAKTYRDKIGRLIQDLKK